LRFRPAAQFDQRRFVALAAASPFGKIAEHARADLRIASNQRTIAAANYGARGFSQRPFRASFGAMAGSTLSRIHAALRDEVQLHQLCFRPASQLCRVCLRLRLVHLQQCRQAPALLFSFASFRFASGPSRA